MEKILSLDVQNGLLQLSFTLNNLLKITPYPPTNKYQHITFRFEFTPRLELQILHPTDATYFMNDSRLAVKNNYIDLLIF